MELSHIFDKEDFRYLSLSHLDQLKFEPNNPLTPNETGQVEYVLNKEGTSKAMLTFIHASLDNYQKNLSLSQADILDDYFYEQITTIYNISKNSFYRYAEFLDKIRTAEEVRDFAEKYKADDPENVVVLLIDWLLHVIQVTFNNATDANEFETLEVYFDVAKFRKRIRDKLEHNPHYNISFIHKNDITMLDDFTNMLNIVRNEISSITNCTCYLKIIKSISNAVKKRNLSLPLYQYMAEYIANLFYVNNFMYYDSLNMAKMQDMFAIVQKSYEKSNFLTFNTSKDEMYIFLYDWLWNAVYIILNDKDKTSVFDILEDTFQSATHSFISEKSVNFASSSDIVRQKLVRRIEELVPIVAIALNIGNGDKQLLTLTLSMSNIAKTDNVSTEMLELCRNILELTINTDHTVSFSRRMDDYEVEYMLKRLNQLGAITKDELKEILNCNEGIIGFKFKNNFTKLTAKLWKSLIVIELGKSGDYSEYFQILESEFLKAIKQTISVMSAEMFYHLNRHCININQILCL